MMCSAKCYLQVLRIFIIIKNQVVGFKLGPSLQVQSLEWESVRKMQNAARLSECK
jgi:hypothetical protein